MLQFISYCFFLISSLVYAHKNKEDYDSIFATSSRLGTAFIGFLIKKFTNKPLYLDLRDIFSDNLMSIKYFEGRLGKRFIKIFKVIETQIISNADWINFVSPGFFTYPHIKKIDRKINLFMNGVDKIFIKNRVTQILSKNKKTVKGTLSITYAGNIGLGQGLELIVIPLAKHYEDRIIIKLIGDGNSINLIKNGIHVNKLKNIDIIAPMNRNKLIKHYNSTDIFLLHLNNIPAFEKVLPSKIFDYGSFDKPMIAGVDGVAKTFIEENIPSACIFKPGEVNEAIKYIDNIFLSGYPIINNTSFVEKYSRTSIMDTMLKSMVSNFYL